MLTPKEFRKTAIPELAGYLLLFLYFICDWPLLYIKAFVPYTGDVKVVEKGVSTFCKEIDMLSFPMIAYTLGFLFIFFTIASILKGFVSKPSWAVYLHTRSMNGMWMASFFFLIFPTVLAILEKELLERNQYIIHADYTVIPAIPTFIVGLFFVAITIYSFKQCLKCYDEFPKQVARAVWPYYSKSWLDKHYGKEKIEENIEKTETQTETCCEEQSPKEETEKLESKQEEPSEEVNIPTASTADVSVEENVTQTATVAQTEESSILQPQCTPPANKKKTGLIAGVIAAVLLAVGAVLYFAVYMPYAKDRDALRTYVGATSVFLRSSQIAGVDNNILGRATYGSEVITYDKGTEWSYVKVDGVKAYIASSYLLGKSDFELLNSVWGNEDAKENINFFRYRMAILDFYRQHEMSGGAAGWQIYTKGTTGLPNAVAYPKLYEKNGKFANFFFIVKNNTTGQRKLVGYSFEDDTERPVFRFVIEAPENGYIRRIRTDRRNMTVEFDNRKKISFPFFSSSNEYGVRKPADSTVVSIVNGNIKLVPGREYWVEGTVGAEYSLKGEILINASNRLLFSYVIDNGWEVGSEYGTYDNGKMVFESGIEATVTDKIEGFWKEDRYGKSCLPLELRIKGYGLCGGRNVPPPPAAAPDVEDVLTLDVD